jgi:hypothetical protein
VVVVLGVVVVVGFEVVDVGDVTTDVSLLVVVVESRPDDPSQAPTTKKARTPSTAE